MGHLGHLKQEYRELVDHLGTGQVALPEPATKEAWEGWREILEILYTPEEALLASRMPLKPTSLRALAERFDLTEAELKPRLDAMCDKGVVMDLVHPDTLKVKYLLAPPVVGFFEFSLMRAKDSIPKKRMAEALHAYTHGDDSFAKEVFGTETVVGRAMVHETALGDEQRPEVLDFERASKLVEGARAHAVSLCYCRHKAEHLGTACDAPVENCLSLNAGAEFIIRRGFGRKLEKAEAMALLEESRKAGLVQIADNVQDRPTFLCNCCGCCCGQLQAINEYGLAAVNPSGFIPGCVEATCKGCSRCSRACPVTAIDMVGKRMAAKRKNELRPKVNVGRCIGCGVCVGACKSGALSMRRHKRPKIPKNAIEKAVRMAVERGRLAHLVFDEDQQPILNRVLKAVTSLPPAQKLLASEQLKSRFVRYAAATVKDPTGG
ncbi:MAG: 4Fe-4S dicluster domain-containing protein [Myxococcaceae bacterium]